MFLIDCVGLSFSQTVQNQGKTSSNNIEKYAGLPFKEGVRRSSRRWVTKRKAPAMAGAFLFLPSQRWTFPRGDLGRPWLHNTHWFWISEKSLNDPNTRYEGVVWQMKQLRQKRAVATAKKGERMWCRPTNKEDMMKNMPDPRAVFPNEYHNFLLYQKCGASAQYPYRWLYLLRWPNGSHRLWAEQCIV